MPSPFEVPLTESVQILRRVLPLMSRQRVPTIAQNYAIWCDFVAERNEALAIELQGLIVGAMMLAESIRALIEVQVLQNLRGEEIDRVTLSLGVAEYVPGETATAFIQRADACLYRSKENGRNRVTSETELVSH